MHKLHHQSVLCSLSLFSTSIDILFGYEIFYLFFSYFYDFQRFFLSSLDSSCDFNSVLKIQSLLHLLQWHAAIETLNGCENRISMEEVLKIETFKNKPIEHSSFCGGCIHH